MTSSWYARDADSRLLRHRRRLFAAPRRPAVRDAHRRSDLGADELADADADDAADRVTHEHTDGGSDAGAGIHADGVDATRRNRDVCAIESRRDRRAGGSNGPFGRRW